MTDIQTELKTDGNYLVQAERLRQVEEEGFEGEHDDQHYDGELAQAAHCYQELGCDSYGTCGPEEDQSNAEMPDSWPWDEEWWKPKTRLRNLVRAGALYQAEIDRLLRQRDSVVGEINYLLEKATRITTTDGEGG